MTTFIFHLQSIVYHIWDNKPEGIFFKTDNTSAWTQAGGEELKQKH